MPISHHLVSAALSFSLVFLSATSAIAAKQVDICPTSLSSEAELRLAQLEDSRQHLEDFMSGGALSDTPLTALFVVDLNNEAAIKDRIKELQLLQSRAQVSADLSKAYLSCSKSSTTLTDLANKVSQQQLLLNKLRLDFLALPQARRNSLIGIHLDRQKQANTVKQLAEEQSVADKLQNEAAISVATAEELAKSASSLDLREIAAQRALLEKTRETLGRLQAAMVTDMQERAQFSQQTSNTLSALGAVTISREVNKQLPTAYQETVAIWRELVDRIFERIAATRKSEPVPDIPMAPDDLLSRLKGSKEAAQYQSVYQEIQALETQLASSRLKRFEEERNDLYRLLLEASHLRSALLQENLRAGHEEILNLTSNYFQDIGREMRIVPYQMLAIFYSKAMDLRQKAGSGVEGWLNITKQSFLFLLFVAVLFATFTGLHRVSKHLDRLRSYLVREKHNQAYVLSLALWIQRGNAYVPWVIMLLGVYVAQDLVAGSDIAQIGLVLPYVAFYLWYRIFLNFTYSVLRLVAFSGALESKIHEKKRLHRSVRLVGIFFFVLLGILHATQDAVGEALVYRLVYGFVVYVGIIVCAYAAREWQKEIAGAAKELLPDGIYQSINTLGNNRVWSWFVSLPTLFLVIFTKLTIYLKKWAGEFDFFKKISAAIFLRRIEHANKASGSAGEKKQQAPQLPQGYLQWFKLEDVEDKSLLIEPESKIITEVEAVLDAWSDNSSLDHSLALYGEKGSGKSCLLDMIELRYKKCATRHIDIPPKLTTREAVLEFFGKELGMDLSQGDDALLTGDAAMPDTVLLIDNAQNLFLGELGGFEGYRVFAELMNSGTEHLFWCVAFNLRSWHYLHAVFGGMPLFRKAIEIGDFSDTDILNLVMARHRRTDSHLAYDDIIRATQNADEYSGASHVEKQFFRLLWGQSNGNPRAALMLWIASLSQQSGNRLRSVCQNTPKSPSANPGGMTPCSCMPQSCGMRI